MHGLPGEPFNPHQPFNVETVRGTTQHDWDNALNADMPPGTVRVHADAECPETLDVGDADVVIAVRLPPASEDGQEVRSMITTHLGPNALLQILEGLAAQVRTVCDGRRNLN